MCKYVCTQCMCMLSVCVSVCVLSIWYCYVCVAGLLFCYVYYVSIVSAGFFG